MTLHAPNFNRIARPYRYLEYLTLGSTLQRCRTHFLPELLHCKRALVLGDGDGRFLASLLAANPGLRADAVDTSSSMLHLLRKRCAAVSSIRLRTHHHSALEHSVSAKTDLVVAHFFFDCLTQPELDGLISDLARHLRPTSTWLISDFCIPRGFMRLPALLFVRILYFAFRLLTGLRTTRLPDHASPLSRAGLTRISHHHSLLGILTTELWQTPATK